jgi:hypothetical protein
MLFSLIQLKQTVGDLSKFMARRFEAAMTGRLLFPDWDKDHVWYVPDAWNSRVDSMQDLTFELKTEFAKNSQPISVV